jgi:hypothetical protein
MILTELFDRSAQYTFVRDWQAEFAIADRRYVVDFLPSDDAKGAIDLSFAMKGTNGSDHHFRTHTGNEIAVFSTVIACVREYLSKNSPTSIAFGAEKSEPSRVKLYDRLVRHMSPGWRHTREDRGGYIDYVLINPKVDAQQQQGQGSSEDVPF